MQEPASAKQANKIAFSIDESEFAMDTYFGRFKKFMKLCNPLLLLKSKSSILKMERMVKEQREKEHQNFLKTGKKHVMMTKDEIKRLRYAETLVKTSIHPDTGEVI